ncbi:conserved Plasmodium protein, unknown function [Plasmodium gallinaceum]|uniref:Uncharacterized protein n=1 Tax=Plasmodium gallinaceum TaxID=5849 RepID=A0A1J1GZZ8_PLAGA|nr:conserved Plasmodium protein, unknown function [Plasmodium gallinaceum]CRG97873.1 conserved Plasmodium protein, unknown function [Plasmodium gallinaceum]
MRHELSSIFQSKNLDEQSFKQNNDYLNNNEALESYLNFYSSPGFYVEPVNFELNPLNVVDINNLLGDTEQNVFNNVDLKNLDTLENNTNALNTSATDFKEYKNDNINITSENVCDFEKDFKQNVEYFEIEKNNNLEVENETKNAIIEDEENLEIKENELNHQNYFNLINEDKNKKDNFELNESNILPLSYTNENEMMYNECALTNDFFETIENINTKVFEKYNNLKDMTENLIDIINKSEFEKRINNLLDLSDNNSELIDKFKKKSEDCIRQCRKFETTSESLIGECVNTLAQTSICYAEWVCLHSFEMDSIDNDLKEIQLFIETSQ